MLYLVLVLVLAAFGLLIAALTTKDTLFAWISVAVSVLAAALLIADWLSGRRPKQVADQAPPPEPETPEPVTATTPPPPPPPLTAAEPPPPPPPPQPPEEEEEPAEEPTDAADLLVVADLSAEVLVVDEHPRYHLPTCTWLRDKGTIPIAISEARQLGFTPCARCGPDAKLASQHRATH